jgi:predicted RNA binding protein YcfA (HicA-like mRNA interferase family)
MGGLERTLDRVRQAQSDSNIRFEELRALLQALGFSERTRGSHHIFSAPGVDELVNLQRDGDKAKAYQVRQVRRVIVKYNLRLKA